MKLNKWYLIIFILLICDIIYTFLQNYYSMTLDGDMCSIIMPSDGYKKILTDPFGFNVLFNHDYYPATNRFFIHWFMQLYFHNIPFLFQNIATPIDSIYLSLSFARTLIQVLIIYLLSNYISESKNIFNKKFLITAFLITPFFQVGGYSNWMGITYNSISYTFFYGLPFIFILLFFLPFYKLYFNNFNIKFNIFTNTLLLVILLIIAFGGPLGPPIILLICPAILLYFFQKNFKLSSSNSLNKRIIKAIKNIPKPILIHFTFAVLLNLYSIYIGSHNSENFWFSMSIADRYKLLPTGFWELVTFKLGLPLILLTVIINSIFISRINDVVAQKILLLAKIIGLLSLAYILLLPLGGYRAYRPNIIRHDTFSPVTISIIFLLGLSSLYLLHYYRGIARKIYILIMILIMCIFTNADRIDFKGNECERQALKTLVASPERIVRLEASCNIMEWNRITDYKNSELNCRMLKYWHILKEKKSYYYD